MPDDDLHGLACRMGCPDRPHLTDDECRKVLSIITELRDLRTRALKSLSPSEPDDALSPSEGGDERRTTPSAPSGSGGPPREALDARGSSGRPHMTASLAARVREELIEYTTIETDGQHECSCCGGLTPLRCTAHGVMSWNCEVCDRWEDAEQPCKEGDRAPCIYCDGTAEVIHRQAKYCGIVVQTSIHDEPRCPYHGDWHLEPIPPDETAIDHRSDCRIAGLLAELEHAEALAESIYRRAIADSAGWLRVRAQSRRNLPSCPPGSSRPGPDVQAEVAEHLEAEARSLERIPDERSQGGPIRLLTEVIRDLEEQGGTDRVCTVCDEIEANCECPVDERRLVVGDLPPWKENLLRRARAALADVTGLADVIHDAGCTGAAVAVECAGCREAHTARQHVRDADRHHLRELLRAVNREQHNQGYLSPALCAEISRRSR